jgi:AcrR family transcriptional regulator
MSAKERWLSEGLQVLAAEGPAGVRIDRLAARIGLSKGSFHHHFAGAAGYKKALLEHYEQTVRSALAQTVDRFAAEPPQRVLAELTAQVGDQNSLLYHPELEVAVRAWAFQDAGVAAVQQRIDEARITVLESLWRRIVDDPGQARVAALLPYLIGIGASVVLPPVDRKELQRVYELILQLVPESAAASPANPPLRTV